MLPTENNFAKMLYAIRKFNSLPGKKALQKILYFAKVKSNTYPFQWNKYGPYSEELKYAHDAYGFDLISFDIEEVEEIEEIEEKETEVEEEEKLMKKVNQN